MRILSPRLALVHAFGFLGLAGPGLSAAAQDALELVQVAGVFTQPVHVTHRPGDFDSLFVVEIVGMVKIVRDGSTLPVPYLDLRSVISTGFEHGILGLAFHPDYPATRKVYAAYTDLSDKTVVFAYDEDPANPDRALIASGKLVVSSATQPGIDHNGGCLAFGPDGMLYVGMGDGSSPNDSGPGHLPGGNAQSLKTLFGKILRLDVDLPYPHIPPSNPFFGVNGARGEIWAYGLRNPWRFGFDALTGDLFVGDVGELSREEISVLPAGAGGLNLGWRCMEGDLCTGLGGCACSDTALTDPVHVYDHTGGLCSVTGGSVYRGCAIPSLAGHYVFGDYCTGRFWSFTWDGASVQDLAERTSELTPDFEVRPTSFGEDAFGELYTVDYTTGKLWKLVSTTAPDCDADGVADACAIAHGLAPDADGDGVPDACGPTCSLAPTAYCAGHDSLGCVSQMSSSGTPSVSSAAPFHIVASNVMSQRPGLLRYGASEAHIAFQGGTLCVGAPAARSHTVFSFGNPVPDCSGQLDIDFNNVIDNNAATNPYLAPGQRIFAQYLYRDPFGPFEIGLSAALKFDICP